MSSFHPRDWDEQQVKGPFQSPHSSGQTGFSVQRRKFPLRIDPQGIVCTLLSPCRETKGRLATPLGAWNPLVKERLDIASSYGEARLKSLGLVNKVKAPAYLSNTMHAVLNWPAKTSSNSHQWILKPMKLVLHCRAVQDESAWQNELSVYKLCLQPASRCLLWWWSIRHHKTTSIPIAASSLFLSYILFSLPLSHFSDFPLKNQHIGLLIKHTCKTTVHV